VRYEASDKPGELPYAVNYTIRIPPGVKTLRGVLVRQHGHIGRGVSDRHTLLEAL
jgi:hypothetical protein